MERYLLDVVLANLLALSVTKVRCFFESTFLSPAQKCFSFPGTCVQYNKQSLRPMTHTALTGAINQLHFSEPISDILMMCHAYLEPDSCDLLNSSLLICAGDVI